MLQPPNLHKFSSHLPLRYYGLWCGARLNSFALFGWRAVKRTHRFMSYSISLRSIQCVLGRLIIASRRSHANQIKLFHSSMLYGISQALSINELLECRSLCSTCECLRHSDEQTRHCSWNLLLLKTPKIQITIIFEFMSESVKIKVENMIIWTKR